SFPALLPMGFHQTDLKALDRLCVEYFPTSTSRPRLMNTLTTVVSLINRASIPARLWINGGLLTEEPDPGDFSATLVLVESVFLGLSADQREFFDWFRTESLYQQYHCDNYGMVIDADRDDYELMQTYWMRQCRFDRGRKSRGIAELLVPSLARS
ncbi:MAG: hypothetical protein RLO48_17605, partial [Bauldia litoralis]